MSDPSDTPPDLLANTWPVQTQRIRIPGLRRP